MKIKLNKIKEIFKKLPQNLVKNAFLVSLILIFFALILGGLVFYQSSLLAQKSPEILEKPLLFNEKGFQEIIKIWQERQKKFEESELKEYFNLFGNNKTE